MKIILMLAVAIGFVSCDNEPRPDLPPVLMKGAYFLNQGQLSLNVEGSLNYLEYDGMTMENDVFQKANKRSIGNTPQCGVRYGDKIYVGTYESNTIEILDAHTFISIKQIKLDPSTTGTNPRAMVTDKNKIYITMFDGYVARLDTLSLEIDGRVKVGPNPEKPAIINNRLFVPNSDGMNYAVGYGTTASIIDLKSFTVSDTVNVPLNPNCFLSACGRLFLLAKGDYYDVESAIYEIDPDIANIQKSGDGDGYKFLVKATDATVANQTLYYYNVPYDKPVREFGYYNVIISQFYTFEAAEVVYPNAIGVDDCGIIYIASYIMDGQWPSYTAPGFVTLYGSNGEFIRKYNIGSGPTCIFFDEKNYNLDPVS